MKVAARRSEGRGRGVFALCDLAEGEVIEVCPVIAIPAEELPAIDRTALFSYYFGWNDGGAIALGHGSLYNHAAAPNAAYAKDYAAETITFRTLRPIAEGEEVVITYDPGPGGTLWFEAVG